MLWTDDPVADWDRHCKEQKQKLSALPKCYDCGERITDDFYVIDDVPICQECLSNYRHSIEKYI